MARPRIVFYLSEQQKHDFEEISSDLNMSTSALVRELVLDSLPRLKMLSDAKKMVTTNPENAQSIIRKMALNAQQDLLQVFDNEKGVKGKKKK